MIPTEVRDAIELKCAKQFPENWAQLLPCLNGILNIVEQVLSESKLKITRDFPSAVLAEPSAISRSREKTPTRKVPPSRTAAAFSPTNEKKPRMAVVANIWIAAETKVPLLSSSDKMRVTVHAGPKFNASKFGNSNSVIIVTDMYSKVPSLVQAIPALKDRFRHIEVYLLTDSTEIGDLCREILEKENLVWVPVYTISREPKAVQYHLEQLVFSTHFKVRLAKYCQQYNIEHPYRREPEALATDLGPKRTPYRDPVREAKELEALRLAAKPKAVTERKFPSSLPAQKIERKELRQAAKPVSEMLEACEKQGLIPPPKKPRTETKDTTDSTMDEVMETDTQDMDDSLEVVEEVTVVTTEDVIGEISDEEEEST